MIRNRLGASARGPARVPPGGGSGGAVTSVFTRVGDVVAQAGDYNSDLVTNNSGVAGVTVSDALDNLAAAAAPVTSVFGRVGVVTAQSGDYNSDLVTNNSTVVGITVSDALDTLAGAVAPQSWSDTLSIGQTSGPVSPQVSAAANLEFLAASPVASAGRTRVAPGYDVQGRDVGNAADAVLLSWAADVATYGPGNFPTVVDSSDAGVGLTLSTGGTPRATLGTAGFALAVALATFGAAVVSPVINQTATGGAAGQPLSITAQAAVTTGGNLVLSGGAAATRGSVDVANDSPLRLTGSAGVATTGSIRTQPTFSLVGLNVAEDTDASLIDWSADMVTLGNSDFQTTVNSSQAGVTGLLLQTGAITRVSINSGRVELGPSALRWEQATTSPIIFQTASAGAAGQNLSITAQAAVTTGGNLVLSGGAAATRGSVDVANDSPLRLTGSAGVATTGSIRTQPTFSLVGLNVAEDTDASLIDWSADTLTVGNSSFPTVVNSSDAGVGLTLATGGTARATLTSASMVLQVALATFGSGVASPVINQTATVGAAGQNLSITAQAAVTTGGNLVLSGGAAATRGSVDVANDSPLRLTGSAGVATTGSIRTQPTFSIVGLNVAEDTDASLVNWSADTLTVGNSSFPTVVNSSDASTGLLLQTGATTRVSINSTRIELNPSTVQWEEATASPTITQVANTTTNGETMSMISQSSSAGNGGDIVIQSGAGDGGKTSDGAIHLRTGGAVDNGITIPDAGDIDLYRGLEFDLGVTSPSITQAGTPATGEDMLIRAQGGNVGGNLLLLTTGTNPGNISLLQTASTYQSMTNGIFIGNVSDAPLGDPAGGGFLYVLSGALTYRGSGGTVTTIGPA